MDTIGTGHAPNLHSSQGCGKCAVLSMNQEAPCQGDDNLFQHRSNCPRMQFVCFQGSVASPVRIKEGCKAYTQEGHFGFVRTCAELDTQCFACRVCTAAR